MRLLLLLFLALPLCADDLYDVLPTGSMKPWFDERHYLVVEQLPFADLKVGDVIIYRLPKPRVYQGYTSQLVCHMVWRKSSAGNVILCKGVANDSPDRDLVTEANYVGAVVKWVVKEDYWREKSVPIRVVVK
jgi:signal peptidase I